MIDSIFKNTRFDWSKKDDAATSRSVDDSFNPVGSHEAAPKAGRSAPIRRAASKTRRAAKQVASRADFPLLAAWIAMGLLSVLVPVLVRNRRMNQYNMYNYNRNGQNNNGQNRYSADAYDYNNCRWYQFNCQSYYAGNERENQSSSPNWYSGWGSSERQRERAAENGQTAASMKFVYAWQVIMFAAILYYGYKVISKRQPRTGLIGMLLVWANMCFVSMWLLANGAIETGGAAMENGGFYSQFAVLIFMTNFWYVLFGMIFSIVLGFFCAFIDPEVEVKEGEVEMQSSTQQASDYQAYQDPAPTSVSAPTETPSADPSGEQGYVGVV